jgi:hypothetical protein
VKREGLHEGVRYGHCADDHDVHEQGEHDNTLVETDEFIVLSQAVGNEVPFDSLEEVPVEKCVNDEVQAFLNAIPVFVDDVVFVADLEASGDPNEENANVDCCHKGGGCNHDIA